MRSRSNRDISTVLLSSLLALGAASPALADGCTCLGDFNGSGMVDGNDLGTLLGLWGSSNPLADFDGSGLVDGGDLGTLLGMWGPCSGPANDACSNATLISPGSYAFCTNYATTDGPTLPASACGSASQVHNDLWYLFAPLSNGTMTVSTCSSAEFDTVIAVYSGVLAGMAPCPTDGIGLSTFVGCNDDASGCSSFSSSITVNVVAGKVYRIRVGGFNAMARGAGTLTLSFTQPGDSCATAIVANNVPTTVTIVGNTSDNSVQALPTQCTGANPGRAEWITYTCTCFGVTTISTCNPGTNFDTMLNVMTYEFDGNCWSTFEECNDDWTSLTACQLDGLYRKSFVQFVTFPGQVLRIAVSGYNGASGAYELTIHRDCN